MGAQAVRLSNVDINKALANRDFEVLFQPIFDLGNGGLARLETFVRWRHPVLGILPPGAFISFFENHGRMSELTRYVLDVALDRYVAWRGAYAPGFSINLALSDLSDDSFAPHLTKVLRDRRFPAELVTLECPMPPVDADLDQVATSLKGLRETGARLAIEVRGRANDYIHTVSPFPFDEIKTGGSAILRFARTVRGPGLSAISDLLDLAKQSKAIITAVGVEDQASLAALKGLGFTAAQGNHLAAVAEIDAFRPGRVNEVRKLLDLAPLGADELSTMFRTTPLAPTVDAEVVSSPPSGNETKPNNSAAIDVVAEEAPSNDEAARKELLERARKKAKAISLAKRAKARTARKAAAIKRAKEKVALAREQTNLKSAIDLSAANASAPAAPQVLQAKLIEEYGETELGGSGGDTTDNTAPAIAEQEQVTQPKAEVAAETTAAQAVNEDEQANTQYNDASNTSAEPDFFAKLTPSPDIAFVDDEEASEASNITTMSKNDTDKPVEPAPELSQAETKTEISSRAALEKTSLKVGAASAYFSPLVRVGGTPTDIGPSDAQLAAVQSLTKTAPPPDVATAPDAPALRDDIAPAATSTADATEQTETNAPIEAPVTDASPASAIDIQTPTPSTPDTQTQTRAVRRPAQNLLTRKYRFPKHFWPKSWKRAFAARQQQPAN